MHQGRGYLFKVHLSLKETLQGSSWSVSHLPLSKEVKSPANGFSVLTKEHISCFHVSAFDSIIKWNPVFFHQSYHRSFGNRKGENAHHSERPGGRSWHHQTLAHNQRDSGSGDHHRPRQLHHQHQGKRRPVPQLCKSSLYGRQKINTQSHSLSLNAKLMQNIHIDFFFCILRKYTWISIKEILGFVLIGNELIPFISDHLIRLLHLYMITVKT